MLELLSEKFRLFDGVFGASDEVLGTIESGVDFEKRILAIYQECRTPDEIDAAFRALQAEMDEQIQSRLEDTQRALFEHFDEDVHHRLRLQLADAQSQLDRFGKKFWNLSRFVLSDLATFDDNALCFDLRQSPRSDIPTGRYRLISKSNPASESPPEGNSFLYRLSHPLGEHVIEDAKRFSTPVAEIAFDITNHPVRIAVIEDLRGRSGWLTLRRLTIESYEQEEYLLFSGHDDDGNALDQETMEKLFSCAGRIINETPISSTNASRLCEDAELHAKATIHRSLEQNSKYFNEAREKLERWADDMVVSAEKALKDTKEQIKILRREARQAVTLEEQHAIQQKIQALERKQRKQRQEIFDVEDEIMNRRDQLIDQLQKRLSQKTDSTELFTVRWRVV